MSAPPLAPLRRDNRAEPSGEGARTTVVVDARNAYRRERRGIGKTLVAMYQRLAAMRPDWRFVMLHEDTGDRHDPFDSLPNVAHAALPMPGARFNLWENVRLPVAARTFGGSVLHAPANTSPRFSATPLVVTIHDLIPIETAPEDPEARRWAAVVARGARAARRILTPSEWSKRQIVARLGVSPDKVVVNYWAPDAACRRVEDSAARRRVRARYGIPDSVPYLLGFGAADPRKNTRRILTAWANLPPELRNTAMLLLVGNQEPAWTGLRAYVDTLGIAPSCRLHGFADDDDLPALLSGAAGLCYPSLSEGFGLPIVDAFACETPVLTSGSTSLQEVAGDAAVLVNPENTDEIAAGMVTILTDTPRIARLRERARARLSLFSWDRCAEIAGRTLAEAASGRRP